MTSDLLGARRIGELLERYDVHLKKSLGQNFVIDPNTIRKVIDAADLVRDDVALEVGAGAGSLTVGLASRAKRVVAFEVDRRLIPILAETVGDLSNVEVVMADALTAPLSRYRATKVVANLPYNVATLVVLRVLEEMPTVSRLTVMTQREVGERLSGRPDSASYGRSSVAVAYHGSARVAGSVSRRAFFPVPNVDSVIVVIDRTPRAPDDPSAADVKQVVAAAFAHRRKAVRNNLGPLAGSTDRAANILERVGVPSGARAEHIDPETYVRIAGLIHETTAPGPAAPTF
ncbi:MAG: rRNA (adenine1518-N6/adenine1519-N6)-dimethyltransferase [Actinomycetota bacterium]|jgi:16S rRNA (adenine1518-N6/adenine1519-N6)-dimethyltransferase|nr:rRNA (adenine1518-N6/adenine1519-N6)-dimethyltransferase [Actinomycetota bacterium]MEA2487148.1 rRNA (adenine1518-N6/adenine1519-N6)-dimethyltransferase [Actinomycetota bacterium]